MDIRKEECRLCDGRTLIVNPDIIGDFRNIPFDDNSFYLVVFDPPHLDNTSPESYMRKKYGTLTKNWKDDLHEGFAECMRVLKPNGCLIFKWNETRIKTSAVISALGLEPLFGQKCGKQAKTQWLVFIKD